MRNEPPITAYCHFLAIILFALALWLAALACATAEVHRSVVCEQTPDPWECRADR